MVDDHSLFSSPSYPFPFPTHLTHKLPKDSLGGKRENLLWEIYLDLILT